MIEDTKICATINNDQELLDRRIKMSIDRYEFGHTSSKNVYNSKRDYQATYNRQKSIFTPPILILFFIVFPLGFILKFGCIEQLVVFLISLVFSFIVSSCIFRRL